MPAIPSVHSLDRPAFVVLLGCVAGLVGYHLELPLYVAGLLAIGGLVSYFIGKWGEVIGVVLLVAGAFWLYTQVRTTVSRTLPERLQLQAVPLEVHYPVAAHAESALRYDTTVDVKGKKVRALMRSTPLAGSFSMEGSADVQLYALRMDNSYHRYLLSEGYQATGRILQIRELCQKDHPTLSERMQSWRAGVVERFETVAGNRLSPEVRGMTYALSLGDRSLLSRNVRQDFTDTGVAHVIAVSGYHLGVIFVLLSGMVSLFLWRWRYRYVRFGILLVGIVAYTLFTGGSTATVRACVMSSIVLLAGVLGRRTDRVQLLSLTMLIFLVVQPLSYLSVGLMLSLSAVWGILTFLPLFQQLITPSLRPLRWLRDAVFVSVAAQIGVLPFLFMFFGVTNLSIIWSNIPLMYLSAVAIPYGLLLVVTVGVVGAVPTFLLTLQEWLVGSMVRVTRHFSLGADTLSVQGEMDLVQVVLYYAIVVVAYRLAVRQVNAYSASRHILDEKVRVH